MVLLDPGHLGVHLLSYDDFKALSAAQLLETSNRAHSQDSQDSQDSDEYYSSVLIAFFYSCFDCCVSQRDYSGSNKPHLVENDSNYDVGKYDKKIRSSENAKTNMPPAMDLNRSLNGRDFVPEPKVRPGFVSTYIMAKPDSPPAGKAKSSPRIVMADSRLKLLIQENITLSWADIEKIAKAILKYSSRSMLPKIIFNQSAGSVKSYQVSIKSSGCSNPDNFVWSYLFLLTQAGLGDDFVIYLLSSYWESENPFFSLLQEQGYLKIEFNLGEQNSSHGVAQGLPCDQNSVRSSLKIVSDYLQAKRNGDFWLSLKEEQDGSGACKIAVEMFCLGDDKGPLLSYDITYTYKESYLRNLIFCAYRNAKCNKHYISTCMYQLLASFEVLISDSILLSGMSFIEFGVDKLELFIRKVAKSMDSLADCIEKNASLNLYDIIVLYNIKMLCSVFENTIPSVSYNVNTMLGVDEDFSLCLKREGKSMPLGASLLKNERFSVYGQGIFGEVLRGLLHEENRKMLNDEHANISAMSI